MAEASKKRLRTCVGCGARSDKVELHRIVRDKQEGVRFDESGCLPGRGAYVCSMECFERAASKGMLRRALKCKVSEEQLTQVAEGLEGALASARYDRR